MFFPAEVWIALMPAPLRARSLRALAEAYTAARDAASLARPPAGTSTLHALASASGVNAGVPTRDARRAA